MRSLSDAETLKQFARNLREGIYITTESGDIVDCNPAFLEMFGVYSLAELKGYAAEDLLLDPRRRDQELSILEMEGAIREFELEIRLPDGQVRIVLDTAYRVNDPISGEILYHGILIDITDRKCLERQLREQVIRGPLTGCYNRNHLAEISLAQDKSNEVWKTIVADVDYFKEYNDRHGHSYGDRILIQIGRFLMQEVRAEDAVFRTGGDEFLVYLPGCDQDRTREIVDRFHQQGPMSAPASFSLGWAVRENLESLESTIRRADQQLIQIRVQERRIRPRRST